MSNNMSIIIPLHQVANVWIETPPPAGKAFGCRLLA